MGVFQTEIAWTTNATRPTTTEMMTRVRLNGAILLMVVDALTAPVMILNLPKGSVTEEERFGRLSRPA